MCQTTIKCTYINLYYKLLGHTTCIERSAAEAFNDSENKMRSNIEFKFKETHMSITQYRHTLHERNFVTAFK